VSASVIGGFFRWWTSELRGLLPAGRHEARGSRNVVVSHDGDGVSAHIEHRGRREHVAELGGDKGQHASSVALALSQLPNRLRTLPVLVRVRASDCYERIVLLPASAQRDFDQLLLLDLERSTPLKPHDLLFAHSIEGKQDSNGMVRVRHLLLKKRTIEPLLVALRSASIEPAGVEVQMSDASGTRVAALFDGGRNIEATSWPRVQAGLAAIVALLLLSALAIYWGKREQALATLTTDSARLEAQVDEMRRVTEQAQAVRAKVLRIRGFIDNRPSTLAVIEEITQLVPDSGWLEELRIDGDSVEIAGLAASATALLPLLERSPLFYETRFTAPLQFDHSVNKERFRLRVRMRNLGNGSGTQRAELAK